MSHHPKNPWWNMISSVGKEGQDLAREILKFDPAKRISARDVRSTDVCMGYGTLTLTGVASSILHIVSQTDCPHFTPETRCRAAAPRSGSR